MASDSVQAITGILLLGKLNPNVIIPRDTYEKEVPPN